MGTGLRVGVLLLIAGALALGGWAALAQAITISVGPTNNPLPGSQFQG